MEINIYFYIDVRFKPVTLWWDLNGSLHRFLRRNSQQVVSSFVRSDLCHVRRHVAEPTTRHTGSTATHQGPPDWPQRFPNRSACLELGRPQESLRNPHRGKTQWLTRKRQSLPSEKQRQPFWGMLVSSNRLSICEILICVWYNGAHLCELVCNFVWYNNNNILVFLRACWHTAVSDISSGIYYIQKWRQLGVIM